MPFTSMAGFYVLLLRLPPMNIVSVLKRLLLESSRLSCIFIITFRGAHLDEVLNSIDEGRPLRDHTPKLSSVKVGGTVLDIRVSTLPAISRDLTDRNRTSPFAFTGNKFEFRAVGSKQSPSFPVTVLNTAVAQSLQDMHDALVKQMGSKSKPSDEDIMAVVRVFIKQSKNVRFEGNGYSQEWVVEAEKRGLPNIRTAPEAFKQLLLPHNSKVLVSQGVLSEAELHSRYHIMNESYSKNQMIEANTLKSMVLTGIIPATLKSRKLLIESLAGLKEIGLPTEGTPEKIAFDELTVLITGLQKSVSQLGKVIEKIDSIEDPDLQAEASCGELVKVMGEVRGFADSLELVVDDLVWPWPKYTQLLF